MVRVSFTLHVLCYSTTLYTSWNLNHKLWLDVVKKVEKIQQTSKIFDQPVVSLKSNQYKYNNTATAVLWMFSKVSAVKSFLQIQMNKKCNKEGTGLKLISKYSQWVKKARLNKGLSIDGTSSRQKIAILRKK